MYTIQGKLEQTDTVQTHAPLVRRIALQLAAKLPASVQLDDLIQAGMIGLLDAARRYEDTHGARFETYASQRIRGAMLDEVRANDWQSRSLRQSTRRIERTVRALEQKLGRTPLDSEVAEELEMPLDEYQSMLNEVYGCQLLHYEDFERSGEEDFLDRHLTVSEDGNPLTLLMESGMRGALIRAIERLPEREKLVLSLCYDQELNLREIGAVLEVTESRVCQIRSQAINRLRSQLRGLL
ncbi:DNA-directed RNA polymerase specialized sigma subunit [Cupriavidus sp. H18C1]|mgnify:CR=1 FL=1|jgi:RNA polymerase sigma factor, FliA/WhiG family|uniref:RNA polymerase sigma factor FliA n=2 Tax=Cupriavidus TaxID=106589 RepID=A0A5M8A7R4_9BURK|nr:MULTISPECIES: RNA polymerase sigma factor FliA [Cupriavidus]ALD93596.1 sigma-70 region 4 [Cupriavidus gilardii CR3]QQE08900.1 RNA polymerase sigma factor FliA [Cupriavidus sp. ISTL7]KAA0179302.1 RNA polymerase sigma factor FliA [Cupriavidus gilardii]KAA6118026.1 RNA polymerase sigma factor FliA [Cupriavidus cauae]KAB0595615.1 RNA polymerase sigma factor FliA [Cupriavidus gilardii]